MTFSEENYLKSIYTLQKEHPKGVSTNVLSKYLDTKPASATEMIKKLDEKGLVHYQPYQGVILKDSGAVSALKVIRKHRLWETFLFTTLDFNWIEIHEVAEQLEHIKSEKLVEKIDKLLGYPNYDPHGDPIPDKHGKIPQRITKSLFAVEKGKKCIVLAVCDTSKSFLNYLEELGISIKTEITIVGKIAYDNSIKIRIKNEQHSISRKVAGNLLVDDSFN